MKAVIFDMDGTIANVDHRLKYIMQDRKDWDTWNKLMPYDTPNIEICKLTHMYYEIGYVVIICSGRFEKYRKITKDQLDTWGIEYASLYMRADSDYRSDVDVKYDMLRAIQESELDLVMCFDDRDRVVKMYRDNDITCLQVKEGDY